MKTNIQKMTEFKLTREQEKAYSYMVSGKSILISGIPGAGKTETIKYFRTMYQGQRVIATTSTTGRSAILINGTTLHSYLGINTGSGSVGSLSTKILKSSKLRAVWRKLETLIIDEISMLSPELFDKLEEVARIVRNNKTPFGGIQLILSGDFNQIPPIGTDSFCFEAKSWKKCIDYSIFFRENIRQTEKEFRECLLKIRDGIVDRQVKQFLKSVENKKLENGMGIEPTKMFATNVEVDEINNKELDKLAETGLEFFEYEMETELYTYVPDREYVISKYRKNCVAPEVLQLCVGAQVMLLWNMDPYIQLVNGSRGVVTSFIDDIPVVKFLNGEERLIDYYSWEVEERDQKLMKIVQIPLKVAYGISIHKCQGTTLDYAIVDMSSIFAPGQAYVALSRVRKVSGLSISGLNFSCIKSHPKAVEYYRKLEEDGKEGRKEKKENE